MSKYRKKKCIFTLTRAESLKSKNGKGRNVIDNGSQWKTMEGKKVELE